MKPHVFIGSSAESLTVAQQIKDLFAPEIDCQIWSENFFAPSSTTIDELLQKAALFDGGLILLTKDDRSLIRGRFYRTARDNAIFEAGLFFGRLGRRRTFLMSEKGIRLPSDLAGFTTVSFKRDVQAESYDSLAMGVRNLKSKIEEEFRCAHFTPLPSTSLAIGYFVNFVVPVVRLIEGGASVVDGETEYRHAVDRLEIVLPDRPFGDMQSVIEHYVTSKHLRKGGLVRDGSRNFNVVYQLVENDVAIVDFPSTISVIHSVAQKIFITESFGPDKSRDAAVIREMQNFEHTLHLLLAEDPCAKAHARIKHVDEL